MTRGGNGWGGGETTRGGNGWGGGETTKGETSWGPNILLPKMIMAVLKSYKTKVVLLTLSQTIPGFYGSGKKGF